MDSVTDKPAQSEERWGKGAGEREVGKEGSGDSRCCQGNFAKEDRKEEGGKRSKKERKEG
jgi:hypothetical protein